MRSKALSQAYRMQDILFEQASKPGVDPALLKPLIDAWERLEDRKRIIRGRPLPGALRPTATKPKRQSHSKLLIDAVDQSS